ncbi:MAG: ABC transporter permease [Acutalibacteraceae bacterium]|nr:ABC transporter permease [Acutalibacteraceae bacterium]
MIKKSLSALFLGAVVLFMYLPILVLSVYSFTSATAIGQSAGFSFDNYVILFKAEELKNMIVGTLLLALGSAVLATLLGTTGAIGAFYSKRFSKTFINQINQIPVVNADVLTGFSICVLLIALVGIPKNTFLPLIIGHTVLSAPFVYLSVVPKLKQMDSSLYEAALDLGASPTTALFKIVIPQIVPGIISGFMMAVTLSLDDYFITTYTKPTTFDTISTYVVNATKGGQTEIKTALWALSTVIFVVITTAVIVMNVVKKDDEKGESR